MSEDTGALTIDRLSVMQAALKKECQTKYCCRCKELKLLDQFCKDNSTQDGLNRRCKLCTAGHGKVYRGRNKEKRAEYNFKNRDEKAEYNRTYYHRNKERFAEHYVRTRGERIASAEDWQRRNPDRHKELQSNSRHKRRAQSKGGDKIYMSTLYLRDKGICQICKFPCSKEEASVDHIQPLSKNGTHTWGNVQLAHLCCNLRKHARLPLRGNSNE
jgi:5-methylcytosine-specific restriction endonuclease McrA